MTAVSAFSAIRRGSRKPGKYEPFLSFGMRSSAVPARVSQTRSRWPLRWTSRSALFSPQAAPVTPPTSSSISRSAAKPIISRSRSASGAFSTRLRSVIISSVIV
jgi:hypothetical protein